MTHSATVSRSQTSFRGSVTRALRPYEPSSVQMMSSSAMAAISFSRMSKSLVRAPIITMTLLPARFIACAMGCIGATPMPPPTQTTVPFFSMWVGWPKGPRKTGRASPSCIIAKRLVEAPTAWKIIRTAPFSGSASAMVSGMRSPNCSSICRMMNCPARRSSAINGAWIHME